MQPDHPGAPSVGGGRPSIANPQNSPPTHRLGFFRLSFFLFRSCIRLSQHHTVHFIASGIACGEVTGDEAIPGLAAMRAMASAGSGWTATMDLAQLVRVTKVRVAINTRGVGSADISGTSVTAAARHRVGGTRWSGSRKGTIGRGSRLGILPLFFDCPMTPGFEAALQWRRTLVFRLLSTRAAVSRSGRPVLGAAVSGSGHKPPARTLGRS